MKTLIIILILCAFLQTTILPIDLVLLALIFRSYIVSDKSNLYLAFFFGLLVAHLSGTNLGVQSVIYLLIVQLVRVISKIPALNTILTIIPITFLALTFNSVVLAIFNGSSIQLWPEIFLKCLLPKVTLASSSVKLRPKPFFFLCIISV